MKMQSKIPVVVEILMALFTIGSTLLSGTEVIADVVMGVVVYFSSRFLYRSYGDQVYNFLQRIKERLGIK